MKTLFLASVLALVAGCAGCASIPSAEEVFDPAPATLTIQPELSSGCSATAVGPQTLLTASHCIRDGALFLGVEGLPVAILSVERDLTDHALVKVSWVFPVYAEISLTPPVQGDRVRMWGNPGVLEDQYREGYIAGYCPTTTCFPLDIPVDDIVMVAIPGWKGDSGAALFNPAGQIVGVISTVTMVGPGYIPMGAAPFTFTPEQLAGIR